MKPYDHLYCVCCGKIITKENADHVFTTGFYKVDTPLGCCKECALENAQEEAVPSISDSSNIQVGHIIPVIHVARQFELYSN